MGVFLIAQILSVTRLELKPEISRDRLALFAGKRLDLGHAVKAVFYRLLREYLIRSVLRLQLRALGLYSAVSPCLRLLVILLLRLRYLLFSVCFGFLSFFLDSLASLSIYLIPVCLIRLLQRRS